MYWYRYVQARNYWKDSVTVLRMHRIHISSNCTDTCLNAGLRFNVDILLAHEYIMVVECYDFVYIVFKKLFLSSPGCEATCTCNFDIKTRPSSIDPRKAALAHIKIVMVLVRGDFDTKLENYVFRTTLTRAHHFINLSLSTNL